MALSGKQKAVLKFLKENGETKKSVLVEKFGWWYYSNASHHLGLVLSAMVRNNILVKPRHGYYALNPKPRSHGWRRDAVIENQMNLF